jgi:hypothetical protein
MIQVRAYEIYQMRGGHPGREAQDWFHAENEVLAFLLADESARDNDQPSENAAPSPASAAPMGPPVTDKPKSAARKKSGEAKKSAPRKGAAKRATQTKTVSPGSKSIRVSSKSKTEKDA